MSDIDTRRTNQGAAVGNEQRRAAAQTRQRAVEARQEANRAGAIARRDERVVAGEDTERAAQSAARLAKQQLGHAAGGGAAALAGMQAAQGARDKEYANLLQRARDRKDLFEQKEVDRRMQAYDLLQQASLIDQARLRDQEIREFMQQLQQRRDALQEQGRDANRASGRRQEQAPAEEAGEEPAPRPGAANTDPHSWGAIGEAGELDGLRGPEPPSIDDRRLTDEDFALAANHWHPSELQGEGEWTWRNFPPYIITPVGQRNFPDSLYHRHYETWYNQQPEEDRRGLPPPPRSSEEWNRHVDQWRSEWSPGTEWRRPPSDERLKYSDKGNNAGKTGDAKRSADINIKKAKERYKPTYDGSINDELVRSIWRNG